MKPIIPGFLFCVLFLGMVIYHINKGAFWVRRGSALTRKDTPVRFWLWAGWLLLFGSVVCGGFVLALAAHYLAA